MRHSAHPLKRHLTAVVVAAVMAAAAVPLAATTPASAHPASPTAAAGGSAARSEAANSTYRWGSRTVTWSLALPAPDWSIPSWIQYIALVRAFDEWDRWSGIRFVRVADCGWFRSGDPRCTRPDIRVFFLPAGHYTGDSDRGFTATESGHAFPPGPSSISGDIHLRDDAPSWAARTRRFYDLPGYIAHELGHAIGIPHAPAAACPYPGGGALMCPAGNFSGRLSLWDIREARRRYGA